MKRIAAIVLPRLACELARQREPRDAPLGPYGVLIVDEVSSRAAAGRDALTACSLAAVDEQAWRFGARPGQSVAEATAFVGRLHVLRLANTDLDHARRLVAEVALGLGTTAALALEEHRPSGAPIASPVPTTYPGGAGAGPAETVWLDVSGCARLMGGEEQLRDELCRRTQQLGHWTRVAIADGPRIAQAVARWCREQLVVPQAKGAHALASLPITALPLDAELRSWLGKLGILHVGDLVRLERAQLAARLGPGALDLLALLEGRDDVPLLPYEPPRRVVEEASFEHEQHGTEPLLFVLGGLVSRAAARLEARGEAAARVRLELGYDRGVARLRGLGRDEAVVELELPLALSGSEELLRAVRAKIEALELSAPVTSVRLTLDGLRPVVQTQLDLSRGAQVDPHALPILLAELNASLGPERVGVLRWADTHRPEAQSQLVAADVARAEGGADRGVLGAPPIQLPQPTRVLPRPLPVGRLKPGELLAVDHHLLVVDRLQLESRIDGVQWWMAEPVCRDYARAWVHTSGAAPGGQEHGQAWVFVERRTGQGFIHGWFE